MSCHEGVTREGHDSCDRVTGSLPDRSTNSNQVHSLLPVLGVWSPSEPEDEVVPAPPTERVAPGPPLSPAPELQSMSGFSAAGRSLSCHRWIDERQNEGISSYFPAPPGVLGMRPRERELPAVERLLDPVSVPSLSPVSSLTLLPYKIASTLVLAIDNWEDGLQYAGLHSTLDFFL